VFSPTSSDVEELMSDPNNADLRDLILALDRKMDALDKKVDMRFAELTGEIKRVEEKLMGEIKRVEEKLTGEIKRVEEKVNGIDKRLTNEEFISRSAFTAVIVGAMAGLVKYLFFSSNA